MATKDTYERISIDIVAAAKATFARGRRTEAIEMLRRFDMGRRGKAAVAEALQELMAEQQRLIEEERSRVRAAVDEHLGAAEGLVASGMLPEAWARACDALHLDPNDPTAIALEGRIRKALDEQAGRVVSPDQPKPPVDRGREAAGGAGEPRRQDPGGWSQRSLRWPCSLRLWLSALVDRLASYEPYRATRTLTWRASFRTRAFPNTLTANDSAIS
jgi:hypothetical protein